MHKHNDNLERQILDNQYIDSIKICIIHDCRDKSIITFHDRKNSESIQQEML